MQYPRPLRVFFGVRLTAFYSVEKIPDFQQLLCHTVLMTSSASLRLRYRQSTRRQLCMQQQLLQTASLAHLADCFVAVAQGLARGNGR